MSIGTLFVALSENETIMSNEEKNIDIEDMASVSQDQQSAEKEIQSEINEETASEKETETSEVDPLEEANAKIAELTDKYLRAVAEFENYKKRTLKEKTELILNGGEKTITAILPVLDDMERAIANADKADSIEKLEEGWELICKKFQKTLENMGVKKIDTKDADFDVDFHEAIAMVPGMGDDKKGKVIDCVQTGYMLNEKVIRHAKVAVGQ